MHAYPHPIKEPPCGREHHQQSSSESPALVEWLLDEARSDRASMGADLKAALVLQRNEIEQQQQKMETKMEQQRKEMEHQRK